MRLRKSMLAMVAAVVFAFAFAGPSLGQVPTVPTPPAGAPSATPEGCHGAATLAFKQATGQPSQAIGILPQAHSELGRGKTLQAFLGATCGVGSLAP